MPTTFDADVLARDHKIAIVVARFNEFFTKQLLEGAIHAHARHGGLEKNLTVAWVPGSFELPIAAQKLASSGKYQAVICLGCVIRGSTGHYDHVAGQCSAGIAKVGLDTGVPTIFGVITTENLEQAIERAGSKQGNAGEKAMLAAIEMANLFSSLGK